MENWWRVSHLYVTVFLFNFSTTMVSPAIPDTALAALCPGKDECSTVIYITGFQQAISGIGSVMMMPLIGNLSDVYGRKTLLTIPLFLSIIPPVILAWKRTKKFVYAYYVIKTLTSMVAQNGVVCLAVAYLIDNISERKRVSALGILTGLAFAAMVSGTLASRILPITHIFQVSATVSIVAALYMLAFLKEQTRETGDASLEQPILEVAESSNEEGCKIHLVRKIPSPRDVFRLLKSSTTVSLLALVGFFSSFAEAGVESFTVMFFDSIAWAPWVPYASSSLCTFLFTFTTTLRSIISKEVGPNEQGLAQGCILGITALANTISPFIYSPLSAWVLPEDAPFHFQGFSILCIAFAWLIACFLSLLVPILSRNKPKSQSVVV